MCVLKQLSGRRGGGGVKRQILMRPSSGVSICLLRQATGDSAGGRQGCVCVSVWVRAVVRDKDGSEGTGAPKRTHKHTHTVCCPLVYMVLG